MKMQQTLICACKECLYYLIHVCTEYFLSTVVSTYERAILQSKTHQYIHGVLFYEVKFVTNILLQIHYSFIVTKNTEQQMSS